MAELKNPIEFPCIEITQPIGKFYIGVISSQDLINITFADIRQLVDRDFDKYLGIERPLSKKRVDELEKYVNLVDAAFPTSVIIAVSSSDAEYDRDAKVMKLQNKKDIAKIIDGQHRIKGLEKFGNGRFDLNITLFVEMDIEDQAMVFSTINLKQTKVSKSLVYDLYDYAKSRSPQKTCHNIARLLNGKDGSPFHNKIKVLGTATKAEETVSQATFVDRLIWYISKDPMTDRDLLKREKPLLRATGNDSRVQIFRNLFIEDKDAIIASTLWNYFSAVSERWTRSWNEIRPGYILNRTTGFGALMQFLRNAYNELFESSESVIPKEKFSQVLRNIKLKDDDFTKDNYVPGGTGESKLYHDIFEQTGLK